MNLIKRCYSIGVILLHLLTWIYVVQRQAFLHFSQDINVPPQTYLGRYIAFLARRLCFSSVRQYLNADCLKHLNAGHKNRLQDKWYVASLLKGVKRIKVNKSIQKLPITLDILSMIACTLDMSSSFDRVFWTTCIVGFYSFFRRSTLLIQNIWSFDTNRH